jgi:type I restriction enzyme S subunit
MRFWRRDLYRRFAVMVVPENWRVVPLGDVLIRIVGGGTPSKKIKSYWNGSIPWLTVKDMRSRRPADSIDHISETAVTESSTNIIPADTVIIATRIGLGKVVRVAYDSAINQDLKALIATPEIDKGYLEYWFLSIASYLESMGSGTTVKGIRLEQVRSLPFPLAPLAQQKRIVAEIEKQFSRLDEAVANLKRVKANLKRYKAAVLKAAVEGKLTEEWRKQHPDVEPADKLLERIIAERREKWQGRGKYKGPVAPDTFHLPKLPEGWVWLALDSLISGIEAGKSFKCDERAPGAGEVGVVKVSAVSWGEYDEYESKTCLDPNLVKPELFVRSGDFLFSRANTIELVGACVIAKSVTNQVMLSDKILRWKLVCGFDRWVLHCLRSSFGRSEIERLATGNQESMRNIGQERIRSIRIPLPPVGEREVALANVERCLSIVAETEAQIDDNLRRSDRLRQSTLKQAFSGKLGGV